MERREHEREAAQRSAVVTVRGIALTCSVKNISQGGALLQVVPGQTGRLTMNDIGQEVLYDDGSSRNARVIRLVMNGDHTILAIFFL